MLSAVTAGKEIGEGARLREWNSLKLRLFTGVQVAFLKEKLALAFLIKIKKASARLLFLAKSSFY